MQRIFSKYLLSIFLNSNLLLFACQNQEPLHQRKPRKFELAQAPIDKVKIKIKETYNNVCNKCTKCRMSCYENCIACKKNCNECINGCSQFYYENEECVKQCSKCCFNSAACLFFCNLLGYSCFKIWNENKKYLCD